MAAAGAGLGLYLAAGAQVDDHDFEPNLARRAELKDAIRAKERASYVAAGVAGAILMWQRRNGPRRPV